MPSGRPTVLTEVMILELEKRFRDGATTLEAINGVLSSSTFYDHLNTNQEFADRIELAKDYTTEIARAVVSRAIIRGDRESAKWWLERRKKKQFSLRQELTGADGENIGVTISADQAEQLIRARAKRTDT